MATTSTTTNTKPHVLIYPFPTSGHIIPLLDFTHRLLIRGFSVTVLITPHNLSLLHPLLSTHQSIQPLIFPSLQTLANGKSDLKGFYDLHYPLLIQWFRSQQSPPLVMISDFFLGWTQQLASEVGVPRVVFSPSGAFGLSLIFTLRQELAKVADPDNDNALVSFPSLPNCPVFPLYQLPSFFRDKEGDPNWKFRRDGELGNMASWGIVLNTSTPLERVYIENIKQQVGHDRVWAVGPVLPQGDDLAGGSGNRGGSTSVQCHEVMTWLDTHEDGSVVYVCFGSRCVLTSKQMDSLAAALEMSGVHFIWCVKKPEAKHVGRDYADLPEGYEDRVAGKGYIIKGWAPQVEILRHPAVGSFLTHCGWNSTLEGVTAGVVMLTWPMGAEQFINARILVEQLGVGIQVGEGTKNIPESKELAQLLWESVKGMSSERIKAKKVRDAVVGAVAKGGSSDKDLDEFVKSLNEL